MIKFFKNLIFLFLLCGMIFSKMLKYIRAETVSTLDPSAQWNFGASELLSNIFEGLVGFKEGKYEVAPLLATRWEVKDGGKRWIFYLRKGVRFHNGRGFDADAVVYSFKRQIKNKSSPFSVFFPFLKSVEKIDKYTIEILQSKPYPLLLYALANPIGYIVSPGTERGREFLPIGTGPFEFKEVGKNERVVLQSNPDYWGGKPKIDGVVFYSVGNSAWRILQLKNGNADIVRVSSVKEYESLRNYPQLNFLTYSLMDVNYIAFNTRKSPFNSRIVREAMAHIIDKKKLVRLVFQDLALPAISILPPYLEGYNPTIRDYEYNIEKARELLNKAGYPHGFQCSLFISRGRSDLKELLLKFISSSRKIGVKINLRALPYKEFIRETGEGKHNMVALGWVADMPDPDNFLYPLFARQQKGKRTDYYNKKLTEILRKARLTPLKEIRLRLYIQAQQLIHRDIPVIPLYHSRKIIAYNNKIKNLRVSPKGYVIFKDVELIE